MSDVWVRLILVAGALVVVLVVTLLLRGRSGVRPIPIEAAGLGPGVYLFSSSACLDCAPARRAIEQALGATGFVEIRWEEAPGVFHDLGIGAVPATVVVWVDGSAMLFPGMPEEALSRFNP
jgi:hypothetical protein